MISTTGRRPVTAAPKAAPVSASSEIGVSNTRSGPCFSSRPRVTANTPPGDGDVLAEEDTRSSALQLLVERVADRGPEVDLRHQSRRTSGCSSSSLSVVEERGGVGAVDDAVVAGQGERHHVTEVDRPGVTTAPTHRADGEDRGLGRIDDAVNECTPNMPRFETVKVASAQLLGAERSVRAPARRARRVSRAISASDFGSASHDRHEQRVRDRDRDPDVDARVALDPAVDVRRVEGREAPAARAPPPGRRSRSATAPAR